MLETLLLSAARIFTYADGRHLTTASGFFFERDGRLFLVTSRHVVRDDATGHAPDRVDIELHTNRNNAAESTTIAIPLYADGVPVWRQGVDAGGEIDVAALELVRETLPDTAVLHAFTPAHLETGTAQVEVGTPLLIVGFPLGFHDTLHHMPVARQASVASSFGLRFQGMGYFLTDGRTHRGSSGAAVVTRGGSEDAALGDLPWRLLGVHSARLDVGPRDTDADEALGLNTTWYADILLTLTER